MRGGDRNTRATEAEASRAGDARVLRRMRASASARATHAVKTDVIFLALLARQLPSEQHKISQTSPGGGHLSPRVLSRLTCPF